MHMPTVPLLLACTCLCPMVNLCLCLLAFWQLLHKLYDLDIVNEEALFKWAEEKEHADEEEKVYLRKVGANFLEYHPLFRSRFGHACTYYNVSFVSCISISKQLNILCCQRLNMRQSMNFLSRWGHEPHSVGQWA